MGKQIGRADIEAEAVAINNQLSQDRHVAHAEIKSLPGERMNGVRRVASQRQALARIAIGMGERQRIAEAWPRNFNGGLIVCRDRKEARPGTAVSSRELISGSLSVQPGINSQ